jgi:hypothetical protein
MYTLHKLREGFIVTSDEQIKDVRPYIGKLHLEKGCILNIFPTYLTDLSECKLVIAQQDQIDFSELKEEEQKRIGWFDVESICKKLLDIPDEYIDSEDHSKFEFGIKCFQKSLELLSDRRFTLEEGELIFGLGAANHANGKPSFEEVIQSLSQPKSWKIELDMIERYDRLDFDDADLPTSIEPKFTDGKIKVINIL